MAPCAPPQKAKRNKCVRITVDTGDLTADEYDDARIDTTFYCIKSGKWYGHCKFHSRYPDCTLRTRNYLLPNRTNTYEETGEHNHGLETLAYGSSQQHKDEIVLLLTLNKFKPAIIRTIIENKFNVSSNETERYQM